MTVEIDDRIYSDFVVWAKLNNMDEAEMEKYINKAFQDRFMTDKYGDLNEKFEKKKPTRTRKTKTKETAVEPPEPEVATIQVATDETTVPEQTEPVAEPEKPKTTRKKVLKSK